MMGAFRDSAAFRALRKSLVPAAIVAGAGVATGVLWLAGVVDHTEHWLYDLRLRGRPNPEISDAILPVPIDDVSTDQIGRYPWPRQITGALARRLSEEGARGVLLDITFNDLTDPTEDAAFVAEMEHAPAAIAAFSALPNVPTADVLARLSPDKKRALAALEARVPVEIPGAERAFPDAIVAASITPPIAELVERGPGLALASTAEDDDGVLRRVALIRRDESPFAPKGKVRWVPSLPLALACRYYGVPLSSLRAEPGRLVIPGARAPGEHFAHDVRIPVDSAAVMRVDFATAGAIAAKFVRFVDMRAGLDAPDPRVRPKVKDRIALVYLATIATGDRHTIPNARNSLGGLFNAEALNTILTGRFVREPPPPVTWVFALLEGLLLVAFAARWTSYRQSAAVLAMLWVLLVGGFALWKVASIMVPLAGLAWLGALGGAGTVFWKTFLEDRERIDLMFTLRALQNQALKERRALDDRPTTLRGSTGASTEATDALKRNVEYGRFIESLRDIENLQDTYIGKHYRLLNLIDEGGMGLVFRAWDEALDRTVAIKVLTRYSSKLLKRFQTEARAVGQLTHPNVVQVFAVAAEGDIPYIVMEYVHGTSLSQRIRDDGPLPVVPAVEVILQVARGLDAAHVRHIIHRDIKTSNILLTPDGTAKIIDFGIAKFFKSGGEGLTGEKEIVGTADYMSPEQGSGKPVDHRSDIYSLGITLYRVLTGRLPFRAEDTVAVLLKQIKEPLPDVREARRDVPDELVRILTKMTEKKPDDRYGSCRELCADLEAFLHAARAEPRPPAARAPAPSK